jgi:copper transport protein
VVSVAILFEEAVRAASPTGATWWTTGVARVLALSRWGHLWIAREIALIALTILLSSMASALRRHDGHVRRGSFTAAGILVVSIVSIQALGSHAAALGSGRTVAIAADAVHLLTACLWLGALPALVLILRAGGADEGGRTALLRACAAPFSLLAATSVCLVVVTGLYSAGREIETVEGLTGTSYGHALLAKSALLVLAAALGALNAVRLHGWGARRPGGGARVPAAGRSPSRRLVAVETGVGLILLLLVGVLTATPPARGPTLVRAPDATRTDGRPVEDLVVSLSVSPNRPGRNGFTVLAESSRRPPPAAIDTVALEIAGGRTELIFLKEVEPGRYFGTANLDAPGRLRLTTMIERAGDQFFVPFQWSVSSTPAMRLVQPQGRRLAPSVDGLAVAVLIVALAVALLLVVKKRRGGRAAARHPTVQPAEGVQVSEPRIPEVVS